MKAIYLARIEKGKLYINDRKDMDEYLALQEDGEVQVIIQKRRKPRSDNQNRYYWGVVVRLIADEIGELDQDLVHHYLQIAVGNFKEIKGVKVPDGTSLKNTGEMEEYLERVRTWASSELSICVPLPNEVDMG